MLDHPLPAASPIGRRLLALASLIMLGFSASQAGALPPVQADSASGLLLVAGEPPASEPPPAQDQQAPLADLMEVLEATQVQLEKLSEATALATTSANLRQEVQALEEESQRLAAELAQATSRQSALESANGLAEARIAELTEAVDAARREGARLSEALTRERRENGRLSQSVNRAHAVGQAAVAKLESTQAELAAAQEQLGQAAGAAVEAERARLAARSEADALRAEAARARQEFVTARTEIDRLRTVNAELEQQIVSLHMETRSATEMARQNLVVMAEKIAALKVQRDSARSHETAPPGSPQAPDPVEDEPATAAAPMTSAMPQPSVPEPASNPDAGQSSDSATDLSMVGPTPAPAEADSGLMRFQANIEALNDLEMSAAGNDLFSGIESVNDRAVHVGTTAAWDALPPVGKESYLDSLLEHWVAAQGGEGPAVVRIVDQSGRVLVEKSTP